MSDESIPAPADKTVEQMIALADREAERVGVDWDEVARTLLDAHPELAPGDDSGAGAGESEAIGIDIELLLPLLRALPAGAGTAAFLEALERLGET